MTSAENQHQLAAGYKVFKLDTYFPGFYANFVVSLRAATRHCPKYIVYKKRVNCFCGWLDYLLQFSF